MARGQYFTLSSGERVNFDQARSYEVAGADLLVKWNSGTAAMDATTYVGGAADIPAIDAFLAAPQDVLHSGTLIIDDVTPEAYNRDLFIRANMNQIVNAIFGNNETLNAFSQAASRQEQPAGPALAEKVYEASVAMADKWELENP